MTKDKYLTALQIFGLITAVLDFAFIVFAVVSYSLIYVGVIFVQSYFGAVALTAIAINGAFLAFIGVYLIFRKK
ncbi:MAG: hypothetical protein QM214_04780 [Bacillota bacterium]|jgi:hypothetical protein|nr:hypothetical protein [Bacillota bacterium]HHU43672.1 hypothetical protein [Clostridiales bacterium]